MNKKYYNDAFIGNSNITASFSKYGELLRLYYPNPDYRQYSDFFHIGLKINDSNIIYLHNDINNSYKQYYTENTNILNTEIENMYFMLDIKQTDCVMIDKDILIKKYTFKNKNSIDLNINLLVHSKVISSFNNMAGGIISNDALIQYSHNFTCAILSKQPLLSHQLNNVERTIQSGKIYDKDYIAMSSESAISYDLGTLKPGEETEFDLIMYMSYDETEIDKIKEIDIHYLRNINIEKELQKVENYWKDFLVKHNTLNITPDGTEFKNKLIKVYNRSILFIPLLINDRTGGIAASIEVDEDRDKCGRYSYCWPRDAIQIYSIYDYLGFDKYTELFYEVFLKKTQSKNGMWEQRFYTDGRLAPCWGYQIDETAAVVWGAYEHFKTIRKRTGRKDKRFLKTNIEMLERAMHFIENYTAYILGDENQKDKTRIKLEKNYIYNDKDEIYKNNSYDLWEENEGVHLYSLSAIYAAYDSMIKIYDEMRNEFIEKIRAIAEMQAKYRDTLVKLKEYILNNLVDKQKNIFKRNLNDNQTDISVMGTVYPFEVFEADDKIIRNTVEDINLTIKTYQCGYLRYQNDGYIGGQNPWIISTAWMGKYYYKIKDKVLRQECLEYIVNSANEHGLLAEQTNIDKNENWVIGLAWSHAMFISMLIDEYYK